MACALFVYFLIAWIALPILCARVLGKDDAESQEPHGFMIKVTLAYERVLRRFLGHIWLLLFAIVLPLLLLGYLAFKNVGSGFMPTMDEGGFILDYKSEPGTSLAETDRLLREVEKVLQATPEVQTYSRRTGLQLGGGITEANTGDFFVRLKPPPRRGIELVMDNNFVPGSSGTFPDSKSKPRS